MVIGHQVGKVGIRLLQGDFNIVAVGTHVSMPRMIPSAPDFVSSPEWRSMVFTTSSGVSDLPLWNSTPWRILKVQTLASSDDPTSSARATQLAIGRQVDQRVAKCASVHERHRTGIGRRVETVCDSPPCTPLSNAAFFADPLPGQRLSANWSRPVRLYRARRHDP